jgi:hypothetical protein
MSRVVINGIVGGNRDEGGIGNGIRGKEES